jgi:hypothetical protein
MTIEAGRIPRGVSTRWLLSTQAYVFIAASLTTAAPEGLKP